MPPVGAAVGEQVPELTVHRDVHRRNPTRPAKAADSIPHRQEGIGLPLEPLSVFGGDSEHPRDHQYRQRGGEAHHEQADDSYSYFL